MSADRGQVQFRRSELKDELARHLYGAMVRKIAEKINEAVLESGTEKGTEKKTKEEAHDTIQASEATLGAEQQVELLEELSWEMYWPSLKEFVTTKRVDIGAVVERIVRDLPERARELLGKPTRQEAIDDIWGTITHFAIRDWAQPPFGAACHAWAPGANVQNALDELKAFPLVGGAGVDNVHVCGEAYSDYQGFIEGALRSADSVLETIPKPGSS